MSLNPRIFAISLEQSRRLFLVPAGIDTVTLLDFNTSGGYESRGIVRNNWFAESETDRITGEQATVLEISEADTTSFTIPGASPFGLTANLERVAAVRYGGRTYKAQREMPPDDVVGIWRFRLTLTGE